MSFQDDAGKFLGTVAKIALVAGGVVLAAWALPVVAGAVLGGVGSVLAAGGGLVATTGSMLSAAGTVVGALGSWVPAVGTAIAAHSSVLGAIGSAIGSIATHLGVSAAVGNTLAAGIATVTTAAVAGAATGVVANATMGVDRAEALSDHILYTALGKLDQKKLEMQAHDQLDRLVGQGPFMVNDRWMTRDQYISYIGSLKDAIVGGVNKDLTELRSIPAKEYALLRLAVESAGMKIRMEDTGETALDDKTVENQLHKEMRFNFSRAGIGEIDGVQQKLVFGMSIDQIMRRFGINKMAAYALKADVCMTMMEEGGLFGGSTTTNWQEIYSRILDAKSPEEMFEQYNRIINMTKTQQTVYGLITGFLEKLLGPVTGALGIDGFGDNAKEMKLGQVLSKGSQSIDDIAMLHPDLNLKSVAVLGSMGGLGLKDLLRQAGPDSPLDQGDKDRIMTFIKDNLGNADFMAALKEATKNGEFNEALKKFGESYPDIYKQVQSFVPPEKNPVIHSAQAPAQDVVAQVVDATKNAAVSAIPGANEVRTGVNVLEQAFGINSSQAKANAGDLVADASLAKDLSASILPGANGKSVTVHAPHPTPQ